MILEYSNRKSNVVQVHGHISPLWTTHFKAMTLLLCKRLLEELHHCGIHPGNRARSQHCHKHPSATCN